MVEYLPKSACLSGALFFCLGSLEEAYDDLPAQTQGGILSGAISTLYLAQEGAQSALEGQLFCVHGVNVLRTDNLDRRARLHRPRLEQVTDRGPRPSRE